jgi:proline-specific peptidase
MITTINDCEIYYEVHGKEDGEAIFFIHGAPGLGDCRSDKNAFLPIADKYKLVFMDMRGSGRSEEKPPFTHEQWAADIDELRKFLNIDKIKIHGGSYGGFLALEYVLRYPQNVTHVLLRDTAANHDIADAAMDKFREANLEGVSEASVIRMFEGTILSNEDLKEMFWGIQPLYTAKYDPEKAKEKIDSIFYHYETHNYAFSVNQPNYDIRDQLKNIKVPVLVSVGRHDWITPVSCSETLAADIENSELVIYENSGHSPHFEENDKYLKKVIEFLA